MPKKNIENMIDWYKNQIQYLKSNQLASLYNYFHMRDSKYCLTELLPYCETTMMKILNPDNKVISIVKLIENYEEKLDRDLNIGGIPTSGIDRDAYVKVYYDDKHEICYFWYYTYGLEGDDELIDGIAVDMTGLTEENVEQFIKATGFEVKLYKEDNNG